MSIPQFNIKPYGPMHSTVILKAAVEAESGLTLTAPAINGTVTTTGLTMPDFTVNGSGLVAQLALKAPLASPTFTGVVTVPTPFTLGAVSVTATGTELNYVAGVTSALQTQMNLKATLASPTFTGTVTLPHTTLNGNLSLYGLTDNDQSNLYWLNSDSAKRAYFLTNSSIFILYTKGATDTWVERWRCDIGAATAAWTWSNVTHTGLVLTASGKINPVSGVAGFSVVSTALTLGSLGSVLIPQSAANVTDALAGNIAGCIGLDLTGTTERLYFRGASWFYIAKTGGLSMTKEERLDPNGHKFELGDMVRLVVDRINPDGSFHALPYYN